MDFQEVERLCETYTDLSAADIALVLDYAARLQTMAELLDTDVFIDCLVKGGQEAVIVAEAHPRSGRSLYKEKTAGKMAVPENEPGVFATFQDGLAFHALRAVTQENISVRQDVAPICGENGRIIAVLIKEEDVTASLSRSRKYESMLQTNIRLQEALERLEQDGEDLETQNYALVQLKEMNHRIKNNLQMIASILSMEARRCKNEEAKELLQKNVSRILTIATIHDILNQRDLCGTLALQPLVRRLAESIASFADSEGQHITVEVGGENLEVAADIAVALALVVNELLTNSFKHAFPGRKEGKIRILFQSSPTGYTMLVQDDGIGFREDMETPPRLGLQIVENTVRDKIKGTLRVHTEANHGVSVCIEF